jgi:flagellar motor component MotA
MLPKIPTMSAALIAMIGGQIIAGVSVDVFVSMILVIISVPGIILGIVTLKNIRG